MTLIFGDDPNTVHLGLNAKGVLGLRIVRRFQHRHAGRAPIKQELRRDDLADLIASKPIDIVATSVRLVWHAPGV